MSVNELLNLTIAKSQHCQRNWDLSKNIPQEDIDTLKTAVSKCPAKQNRSFYKVAFIQNRKLIENIHKTTDSFVVQWEPRLSTTNPQTLANLLVVFMRNRNYDELARTEAEAALGIIDGKDGSINYSAKVDEDRAIGIAAGYLNITAHLLGYKTGFYDAQHNNDSLCNMLDGEVLLALGIGFEDTSRNRREHHEKPYFKFPTYNKVIEIKDIN